MKWRRQHDRKFVILVFHGTLIIRLYIHLVKPKRYFFHGCCLKYIKNLNSGRFIFRLCIVQYIYIILTNKCIFFFSRADMVVKLTHEQLRIVNHNVQPGEVIKIIAFAGQSLNFINFLNVSLTKKK